MLNDLRICQSNKNKNNKINKRQHIKKLSTSISICMNEQSFFGCSIIINLLVVQIQVVE